MKVFKVWVDKCDYDTYDSFVCVANSEDEIRSHISIDRQKRRIIHMDGNEAYENYITFYDSQGEIYIEEVNLNVDKPYIVCSSYNAGWEWGDNMEKSPLKAIRAKCLECCCGSAYEVKNCTIHDCNLYPFRLGSNPFRTRSMTDEQKQAASERLKSARLAKKSLTNNEENSD